MSKLLFWLTWQSYTASNVDTPYILLTNVSNAGPNPQVRIFPTGDTPPAFTNFVTSAFFTVLDTVEYTVEWKDDNRGIIILAKIDLFDFPAPCHDPVYPVQNVGRVVVADDRILVVWTNNGDPNFSSRSISVDGGTLWRTVSGDVVTWFNSEILGVPKPIPEVIYKVNTTSCTFVPIREINVEGEGYAPMVVTESHTNVTAVGADDGTINITVTGGSGSFTFVWSDGPTTQNRGDLTPGDYSVTVTDTTTLASQVINVSITEPQVEIVEGTVFTVPMLNSISFVVNPVTPDHCASFQQLDNVLFKNQFFPGFTRGEYYQKICTCDQRIVQFNSDYLNHDARLIRCDTNEVLFSYSSVLKEQNIGLAEDYAISIRNHTPGKSRVYFGVGAPPIPLNIGDVFEILNNLDGFNGSYAIVDIQQDVTLGYAYLIINRNYDILAASSNATARFLLSTTDFNVYEFIIDFASVPPGKYYALITAQGTEALNIAVAVSEPLDVRVEHPKTNLIEYRNIDNAFDMTFTTGYLGAIRVESLFYKRQPGGERSMSRDSDYSLVNIQAKKTRGMLFEVFALPPYLHEKLSVLFDCDIVFINKVQYRAAEGWSEPDYRDRYLLASSSIKVEQVTWFKKYNSDDIGTVSEGGFIMTETGFIKR